jgi:hypothetical protein
MVDAWKVKTVSVKKFVPKDVIPGSAGIFVY